MKYEEVELNNCGTIRILESKDGCCLQFVTRKLNGKKLEYEDIEEFELTADEIEKLSKKMKMIVDKNI